MHVEMVKGHGKRMRVSLAMLLAVGLPFLDGALVINQRAAGRPAQAAFALSSPVVQRAQHQSTCASSTCAARQQQRRSLSTLVCTAATQSVTLLEGTYNIDGFRSNYVVAKPQQSTAELDTESTGREPIVLIHGFGSNKAHFSQNLEALAGSTGRAVYAIDLLGHGQSAKPQAVSYDCSLWDWQVQTLVQDVIGQKVFLVGHSLGGYIAMRLAARSPKEVAGLCLLAPAGRYGVLHPLSFNVPLVGLDPIAAVVGQQTFSKFSSKDAVRSTLQYLHKDGSRVSEEMVQALASPWLDARSQLAGNAICKAIYQSRLEAPWDKLVSTDEMKTVVPTRKRTGPGSESFVTMTYCGPMLTLWGQHDAFLPPETNIEAMAALRRDELSEIKVLDCGHCLHDELPAEVNALITSWVAKVSEQDVDFPIARKPRYRNAPIADESVWKF